VAWINGHPDFAGLTVDLRHERVVVIGNGNVALDVARILTADPDDLARTDISDTALGALRNSAVREVVIAARRRPVDSAFTLPELIGLTSTAEVVLSADDHDLVQQDLAGATDPVTVGKLEILAKLPVAADIAARPRIRLAYRLTPHRVLGTERVSGIEFRRTGTDEAVRLDAGLVLTSIGYRGAPIDGLPFDEADAVVPNRDGRVIDPATDAPVAGAYVAGWIKRGPTGFIGTNKSCAMQTVSNLVDDFNAGLLTDPAARPSVLDKLIRSRRQDVVDAAGWYAIDAAETARGDAEGRPRVKFTEVADMVAAAATTADPPLARRLLAGLLR
jgi:ferredoxin--NADP+ reductase